jgi:hypothetical protein
MQSGHRGRPGSLMTGQIGAPSWWLCRLHATQIGRIKYREPSRTACDRWWRFGRMDGSTPWPGAIRPAAVRRARRTSVKLSTMPVDVMLFAMRLEVECGQLRSAASIAEKAAPYLHPSWLRERRKEATTNSRSRSSEACRSSTPRLPNCRRSRLVASIHLLFVSTVMRVRQAMHCGGAGGLGRHRRSRRLEVLDTQHW